MRAFKKVNKFMILFVIASLVMGLVVVYSFRIVFSSIAKAYEVDPDIPDSELKINKDNLEDAYKRVFEKEVVPLRFR